MSKKDKPLSEKYEAERIVIEKLFDVANIAIGALVFGQFLNPEGISLRGLGPRVNYLAADLYFRLFTAEKDREGVSMLPLYIILLVIGLTALGFTLLPLVRDYLTERRTPHL